MLFNTACFSRQHMPGHSFPAFPGPMAARVFIVQPLILTTSHNISLRSSRELQFEGTEPRGVCHLVDETAGCRVVAVCHHLDVESIPHKQWEFRGDIVLLVHPTIYLQQLQESSPWKYPHQTRAHLVPYLHRWHSSFFCRDAFPLSWTEKFV